MSTVAQQLRQGREDRQLTVHQVADATKIRTDHIEALEEGNYDVFPASVYIRGFVRTYAAYLKLDVPKLLDQLNEELAQTEKHAEAPALTPPSPNLLDWFMFQLSRINWRFALPVLVLVIVTLAGVYSYRAWKIHQSRDPLAELGPGLYQPVKPNDGNNELLPVPTPAQPRR